MTEVERLKAEQAKAQAKLGQLRKKVDEQFKLIRKMDDEIHKAELRAGIGRKVKVKIRMVGSKLNDAVGVLKEVRRTRCLVDYPDNGGEWTVPIENLTFETDDQGCEVLFGDPRGLDEFNKLFSS